MFFPEQSKNLQEIDLILLKNKIFSFGKRTYHATN